MEGQFCGTEENLGRGAGVDLGHGAKGDLGCRAEEDRQEQTKAVL